MTKKNILIGLSLVGVVGAGSIALGYAVSTGRVSFEVQGAAPEASPNVECHVEGPFFNRYRVCKILPVPE
jgi:hypothetical protein